MSNKMELLLIFFPQNQKKYKFKSLKLHSEPLVFIHGIN